MAQFNGTPSPKQRIYTVSNLNSAARVLLENELGLIWLIGELSNVSMPVSGHWYFSLKDSQSQVKCAMFRGNNRTVTFKPSNGQQVILKARVSLYEPRGDYQLIVENLLPEGEGKLQQEFETRKLQLAAEGLFSQQRKRPLPINPKCVGIITSQTGAALHDILQILKRRDPSLPIIIYPTQVQGKQASISIAQAIARANVRLECDVLIVGRGGGSLEDLWAFNEDIVARTIAASTLPIISAVGHEVDVTIADFVADVRAPTPSAAAELVSRDHSQQSQLLAHSMTLLSHSMERWLSSQQVQLTTLERRLERQHPQMQLQRQQQQLDDSERTLSSIVQHQLNQHKALLHNLIQRLLLSSPQRYILNSEQYLQDLKQRLRHGITQQQTKSHHNWAMKTEKLHNVSPLATLQRGYSITESESGKNIQFTNDVKSGDRIQTQVNDGVFYSIIE